MPRTIEIGYGEKRLYHTPIRRRDVLDDDVMLAHIERNNQPVTVLDFISHEDPLSSFGDLYKVRFDDGFIGEALVLELYDLED